jgi:hypothetical protein
MKNRLIVNLTVWKRVSLAIGKSVKVVFRGKHGVKMEISSSCKELYKQESQSMEKGALAIEKSAKVAFQGTTTFTG